MKRILSLILAVSLLIPLFPSVSAEEAPELSGVKLVYNISGSMANSSAKFSDFKYAKNHKMWEYAANRRSAYSWASGGTDVPPSSGSHFAYRSGRGIAIRSDYNNWWAIKINVPKTGYYQPYAYYGTYKNNVYFTDTTGTNPMITTDPVEVRMNYYLVPVSDAGVSTDLKSDAFIVPQNLIGSVNCTNGSGGDGTSVIASTDEFAPREFKKGEYYLVFVPVTVNFPQRPAGYDKTTSTLRGIAGDFILDGGVNAEGVPMEIDVLGADAYDLDVAAYMSDGEVIEDAEAIYSGYDETLISVDKNGVIERIGRGETDITVTVENKGVSVSETLHLTVEPPAIPDVVVTYDIASRMGNSKDTSILFTDFTYETNNNLWAYAGNRRLSYWWTDYGVNTTTTSGADLVYMEGRGIAIRAMRDNWWAIKIRVEEGGIYQPKVSYGTYKNTTQYKIDGDFAVNENGQRKTMPFDVYMNYHLIPVVAGEEDKNVLTSENLTAKNMIGSVLCTDSASADATMKTAPLKKRVLEAGEYYLVFCPVVKNPEEAEDAVPDGTLRALAGNFTLDGMNGIRELNISADTYEIKYNTNEFEATAQLSLIVRKLNGNAVPLEGLDIRYSSLDESVATVTGTGLVRGVGNGQARIKVTVSDGESELSETVQFNVIDNTGIREIDFNVDDILYVREKKLLKLVAVMNSDNRIDIPLTEENITVDSVNGEGVVEVSGNMLKITGEGSFRLEVTADLHGTPISVERNVTVILDNGKDEPTYYTYEMRENAQKNIEKYEWAKETQKSAIKDADKVLPLVDAMLEQMTGEGLPRGRQIGVRGDDYYNYCRYCGEDYYNIHGTSYNFVERPWKIQCNACKRLFPTNDFESFRELGLDRQGYYSVDRAREAHHKMLFHPDGEECTCKKPAKANTPEWFIFYGYGNPDGYLYNELYEEIRKSNTDPWGEKITWNDKNGGADLGTYKDENGKVLWQGGDMWGVDDGWGYVPGRIYADGLEERIGYIALYNLRIWEQLYLTVETLAEAYLYTNDVKYGRAGALLLDRAADLYPDFDMYYFKDKFLNTHGGAGYGAALGRTNESYFGKATIFAADMLYPVLEDPQLIKELSKRAEKLGLENDKSSSAKIWKNWEEGIILASFEMLQDGRMVGNVGNAQGVAAVAAIVIDKQPETDQIMEWIYRTNTGDEKTNIVGGNFISTLVDDVDRDGMGNEASPRYNTSWVSNFSVFARAAAKYKGSGNYQPYELVKFLKMHDPQVNILLTENKHPTIADSGETAGVSVNGSTSAWFDLFMNLDDEEYKKKVAEYIYKMSGRNLDGVTYGIFSENPEGLDEDILAYIDEKGDFSLGSGMLTGYGFAALRGGKYHSSASALTEVNNMRDFWVWFGRIGAEHSHRDGLNLGMDAFGLDIAPDLGYPETTSYLPSRLQWTRTTLSHNTVVVNEKEQLVNRTKIHGTPLHFDDAGDVKLVDVDYKEAYNETENYRRTLVSVKANDDVEYAIDFFRVTGGNTHTYSFHSQAENAYPVEGLSLVQDPVVQDEKGNDIVGSYAGPEAAFGEDPDTMDAWEYETRYPRGYTWLKNVRRDASPEEKFTVEFDVQDYRKILKNGKGIKLRMTQLNNFAASEVAIAGGYMHKRSDTKMLPETMDYVLVKRQGAENEKLDSLFTTVFEPYRDTPYIVSTDAVTAVVKHGTEKEGDIVRAVKVVRENGGELFTDYVIYATNNEVTYTVRDTDENGQEKDIFDFSGFVGVYTLNGNDAVIYRYINDGTVIGDATEKTGAYTGKVVSFQKELAIENYIDVDIDCDDISDIAGRYIYVDNDAVENGVYKIESATDEAEELAEGNVRLYLGTVTLIRKHKDKKNTELGYVYNIKEGQSFRIPTSFVDGSVPEFEPISNTLSTSAGSSINVGIQANSPIENNAPSITYIGTTLPRGASLNAETGVFTWRPDDSQVGDNHVAVTARDSDGRESTVHFTVTVYGNTTGSKNEPSQDGAGTGASDRPSDGSSENANGSAGGGGGGGGGAAPDTGAASGTDAGAGSSDTPQEENKSDENNTENAPDASGETETLRFTDLSNHAWAENAINALADGGVIRGTSETTFTPASNITRADFALLLVRAFRLTSDNTENFADVSAADYFAPELVIARNTGIVSGIGDNRYAPRNNITRQDMMVIVCRVLQKLNVEFGVYDEPKNEDYASVAPYAREAVTALIGAGLVNGKNGLIAPADYTTRAEVAVLIKRIMDYTATGSEMPLQSK